MTFFNICEGFDVYLHQVANVKWNDMFSGIFSMKNGVRQGAVLSAIFYCIYMNDLFKHLRKSRFGCWINGDFFGILGYSDDNLLLAPSIHALQEMVNICEKYAISHGLKFSTDPNPSKCKTKCLAFLKKKRELPNIKLGGNDLPWVSSGNHLGNTLDNKIDGMLHDIVVKRGRYIARNNELIQEFQFCHPDTKFQLNEIYNSSFYGSPLWDLFSRECEMLENSWNTSFRIMFNLSFRTHRFFVQAVSIKLHVKKVLLKRFLGFLSQIQKSRKKLPAKLLKQIEHDTGSTTGSNLRKILLLVGKHTIEEISIKDLDRYEYCPVQPGDEWKVNMVRELIEVRENNLNVEHFTAEELEEVLEHLCTS